MTTDDVILAGFAAEPQYKGKLRVVGKGFSDELYGVGIKKGDTELVDEGERGAEGSTSPTDRGRPRSTRRCAPPATTIPDPPTPGS